MNVTPEQVPEEAHNAAFDVYEKRGGSMSAAIAAALNAWPKAMPASIWDLTDGTYGAHGHATGKDCEACEGYSPAIILPLGEQSHTGEADDA